MAYADTGIFQPSESSFSQPGEYEATQRNIALEKASYLSSMDQFYADLEERQREFDLSLEFEQEQWGEQLGFMQEQQAFEEEAWTAEFAESQEQFDVQADLQQQLIDLQEQQQSHAEQQDWIDTAFGAVGAADVIGGWF